MTFVTSIYNTEFIRLIIAYPINFLIRFFNAFLAVVVALPSNTFRPTFLVCANFRRQTFSLKTSNFHLSFSGSWVPLNPQLSTFNNVFMPCRIVQFHVIFLMSLNSLGWTLSSLIKWLFQGETHNQVRKIR